jgi:hypothetical protein
VKGGEKGTEKGTEKGAGKGTEKGTAPITGKGAEKGVREKGDQGKGVQKGVREKGVEKGKGKGKGDGKGQVNLSAEEVEKFGPWFGDNLEQGVVEQLRRYLHDHLWDRRNSENTAGLLYKPYWIPFGSVDEIPGYHVLCYPSKTPLTERREKWKSSDEHRGRRRNDGWRLQDAPEKQIAFAAQVVKRRYSNLTPAQCLFWVKRDLQGSRGMTHDFLWKRVQISNRPDKNEHPYNVWYDHRWEDLIDR